MTDQPRRGAVPRAHRAAQPDVHVFRNNPWWWYLLFPIAVLWAGIAGIPALALLFTAPPVGFLALLVATGPGLGLIVWGLNHDLKKVYRR